MGKATRNMKNSFITLNPSFFTHLLSVSSPNKNPRKTPSPNISLLLLFSLLTLSGICILALHPISRNSIPCSTLAPLSPLLLNSLSSVLQYYPKDKNFDYPTLMSSSAMVPLPAHGVAANVNVTTEEREFWEQPDGEGYRPCLDFSLGYRKASAKISKEKRKFLVVVVSGGLNQQRNQIVDAVVIARILEASLVVPVLQVNRIWGDER